MDILAITTVLYQFFQDAILGVFCASAIKTTDISLIIFSLKLRDEISLCYWDLVCSNYLASTPVLCVNYLP